MASNKTKFSWFQKKKTTTKTLHLISFRKQKKTDENCVKKVMETIMDDIRYDREPIQMDCKQYIKQKQQRFQVTFVFILYFYCFSFLFFVLFLFLFEKTSKNK